MISTWAVYAINRVIMGIYEQMRILKELICIKSMDVSIL